MGFSRIRKHSLTYHDPKKAYPGYTMISPLFGHSIWLVDMEGRFVHHWNTEPYGPFVTFGNTNMLYRAYRYGLDYEGLKGRSLDPKDYGRINATHGPQALSGGGGAARKTGKPRILEAEQAERRGVISHLPGESEKGFTLFTALGSTETKLIDMQGRAVHSWKLDRPPAWYGELLEDGHLLTSGHLAEGPLTDLRGAAGQLVEYDWDGRELWRYEDPYLHHAFERLANGHTLVLTWAPVPCDLAVKVEG